MLAPGGRAIPLNGHRHVMGPPIMGRPSCGAMHPYVVKLIAGCYEQPVRQDINQSDVVGDSFSDGFFGVRESLASYLKVNGR